MKVLVDTDIGSDIDDALCLTYLLRHPDIEVIGITTVSGKPDVRARLASAFTRFHGAHIPIAVGRSTPLRGNQRQPEVPQSPVLKTWEHDETFEDVPAEDFLADLTLRYPGQVTLLAIGPLTNVASMVRNHPAAISQLARLVCMNGRFSPTDPMMDVPEWNALCDVSAARTVYAARGVKDVLYVSSDVTRRLVMPVDRARERFYVPTFGPLRSMAEIWFEGRKKMTFHDPLAAALLVRPELCSYKNGQPKIDPDTGITRWTEDGTTDRRTTTDVQVEPFFEHYFETVLDVGAPELNPGT